MDQNTYQQGESLEIFIHSMEVPIRESFNRLLVESRAALSDGELAGGMVLDLKVLVIAEPWSGDVLYNLPVLVALAESFGWQLRIFRRDENLVLMEHYKKEGIYLSIPVFIFYDKDFRELAHWIERPQVATQLIDEESLKLRRMLREENKDNWREALFNEITGLLSE